VNIEQENSSHTPIKTRRELIEEKIVSLILNSPEILDLIKDDFLDYFSTQIREILVRFKEKPKDLAKGFNKFGFSKEVEEFLNFLALQGEVGIEENGGEGINLGDEISVCLKELRHLVIKEQMEAISVKIKQSEKEEQKEEEIEQLSKEFYQLSEQLSENDNQ